MIVYGDPEFRAGVDQLLESLLCDLDGRPTLNLDQLRTLLIRAGQLEQGVADLEPSRETLPAVRAAQHITDSLANAFLAIWAGGVLDSQGSNCDPAVRRCLQRAARALRDLGTLTIKVPEGFEFYALFPEQYVLAAAQWRAAQPADAAREAWIIGIRGIGTSLSALVAAELHRAGWTAQRCTVRPTGHPFDRTVILPRVETHACAALVVDEGPGLSGSSMAAVVRALLDRGLRTNQISLLPGHAGNPGAAASPEVRRLWAETRRFVGSLDQLQGGPLDILRARTGQLRPGASVEAVLDLGNGGWRAFAFDHENDWPACFGRFERAKYLVTTNPGPNVLWKWAGLGAWIGFGQSLQACMARREARLTRTGSIDSPLEYAGGFVSSEWIEGHRLTASDITVDVVDTLAAHILAAAGPPLSEDDAAAAIAQLKQMAAVNLQEIGFDPRAVGAWLEGAQPRPAALMPSYGDGRLAPWEWVRTAGGKLVKTDWWGHATDHTIVGAQSVLWDVAGALVEWDLAGALRERLLERVHSTGCEATAGGLPFYELAYTAFRVGQAALCLGSETPGSPERSRLQRALDRYARAAEKQLSRADSSPTAAQTARSS